MSPQTKTLALTKIRLEFQSPENISEEIVTDYLSRIHAGEKLVIFLKTAFIVWKRRGALVCDKSAQRFYLALSRK